MSFFFWRSLLIGTYVYSSFNVYFQHTCMKYSLYKPCAVKCHNSHLHSHGKWVGKKSRTRLWTLYRIIFQFVFFYQIECFKVYQLYVHTKFLFIYFSKFKMVLDDVNLGCVRFMACLPSTVLCLVPKSSILYKTRYICMWYNCKLTI